MKKCILCGETLNSDHPLAIRGINPETMRVGWMHMYCYNESLDALKSDKSNPNRLDQYLEKCALTTVTLG